MDFLKPGQTVNSDRHIRVLQKLKRMIRDKRPDIDVNGIVIYSGKARPRESKTTGEELAKLDGQRCLIRRTAIQP